MTTNMGKIDRSLRLVVAAALVYAAFGVGLSGLWFWLALIVAGVFAVTSLIGNCPLYSIVGIKTCQRS